jgi:predicted nucleotidyltransferase component of viral defense system
MISTSTIKEKAVEQGVSTALIFKEYLHWVILDFLFRKGLFPNLVFQGGTALRFVYGGIRYSEDLDFVLKRKNPSFFKTLFSQLKLLPHHVEGFFPFVKGAQLKSQKETRFFKRYNLVLEVEFLKSKDRTNIEIVNVPSYTGHAIILNRRDIPVTPAIVVEEPREILSDKLLAFGSRDYLKGRDLWDIYFLLDTLKISIDKDVRDMLKKKVLDYGLPLKRFITMFEKRLFLLEEKGRVILKREMDKFLPLSYRNIFKTKYPDICHKELEIFKGFLEALKEK